MVVRVVGQGEVGLLGHLKGIFRNSLFRFVEVQILNSIPRGFATPEETEP
jgi:hypothetical protein